MKLILTFLLTVFYTFLTGQEIKILDSKSHKTIDSVRLYNKNNFIGYDIKNIILKDSDTLVLIKQGYEDAFLPATFFNTKKNIYLRKNNVYEIPEVEIKYLNPKNIVTQIINNAKISSRKNDKNFYHFFYEFKTDNATLQYFNGRVCEQGFKYRVEKQLDFFSKIKYTSVIDEKGKEEYFLQKTNYSHFLDHQMYPILWSVFLKNKKFENYIFKFQGKSNNMLKITFSPKINKGWDYNGYIIFDINDYGVYEFSANLIQNPNNQIENLLQNKISIFIKNNKVGDKYYVLENANFKDEFIIFKGKGKGKEFKANSYQEKTLKFNDNEFEDFDFMKFQLK
jgi:hypothetical protein